MDSSDSDSDISPDEQFQIYLSRTLRRILPCNVHNLGIFPGEPDIEIDWSRIFGKLIGEPISVYVRLAREQGIEISFEQGFGILENLVLIYLICIQFLYPTKHLQPLS